MRSIFFAAFLVIGCGKEAGRVAFTDPGKAEETMQLEDKEVAFWTDIDAEWEGAASARYEIEILQKDEKVASATCDLLASPRVKTSWFETNIGDKHSRRGKGKLDCSVSLPGGGTSLVRVKLKASNITLKKADLVVKQ